MRQFFVAIPSPGTNFSGNPTNQDLAAWSDDKFRVTDHPGVDWFPTLAVYHYEWRLGPKRKSI